MNVQLVSRMTPASTVSRPPTGASASSPGKRPFAAQEFFGKNSYVREAAQFRAPDRSMRSSAVHKPSASRRLADPRRRPLAQRCPAAAQEFLRSAIIPLAHVRAIREPVRPLAARAIYIFMRSPTIRIPGCDAKNPSVQSQTMNPQIVRSSPQVSG